MTAMPCKEADLEKHLNPYYDPSLSQFAELSEETFRYTYSDGSFMAGHVFFDQIEDQ